MRTKVSNLDSVSTRDMTERMQQLLWFNNKLQLSLRRLYSLQRQKNILKHKVCTRGVCCSEEAFIKAAVWNIVVWQLKNQFIISGLFADFK